MGLRVLVIGGGGREHALCWAAASSPQVEKVYCAPGNAGIADVATVVAIKDSDTKGLLEFARRERIDLTIVGPEGPLVAGLVDEFKGAKLRVFGPSAAAARLEGSKVFAKEFMRRHYIPTAPFSVFDDPAQASQFIRSADGPLVVKADGLAAGKGVIVCSDTESALAAVQTIMVERVFGDAGARVIVEKRLTGTELSVMAVSDGQRIAILIPARDYKAAMDGDSGPNTGGMGAYAPALQFDDPLLDEIAEAVLKPTVMGMAAEGNPYTGVLYAGMMITDAGPRVLEYNCRFGDPETQVVLPLLKTDLIDVIGAALAGQLHMEPLDWHDEVCVCVILVSDGYPGRYETGQPMSGPLKTSHNNILRFHAGTAMRDDVMVTAGGRVVGICGRAPSHEGAVAAAYQQVEKVQFKGMRYRTDIGLRQGQTSLPRRTRPERRAKV